MAKVDEVERIKNFIKPLREVHELGRWIVHTTKMIEKVPGLKSEGEMLEIVLGGKIEDEEMKRYFLRGNMEAGDHMGLKELTKYLERDMVRAMIAKEEGECVQLNRINNNKLYLIDYVEKKYNLLLAK